MSRRVKVWSVNPTSIQQTINKAKSGDTILLSPGTYQGPITLKPGIKIQGEVPFQAIVLSGKIK